MYLLQNSLAGSSYVDARYATVNSAAGDQLIMNTIVNREFIILLPVYLVSISASTANMSLDTLPYAEGTSWNPNLVCLESIHWQYHWVDLFGRGIYRSWDFLVVWRGRRQKKCHCTHHCTVLRQSLSTRFKRYLPMESDTWCWISQLRELTPPHPPKSVLLIFYGLLFIFSGICNLICFYSKFCSPLLFQSISIIFWII